VTPPLVDIHCHLLPGIDDGAADLTAALAMARIAAGDGIATVVATPHQLGAHARNRAEDVRRRTREFAAALAAAKIPLAVLPGGDVRVDDHLPRRLADGEALTLGDHGRHLLLELPHELYVPLDGTLAELQRAGVVGVLSHPERNAGLLAHPNIAAELVDRGCLMQVTAGSFRGAFGPAAQRLAEWMLAEGLVHFVATDAHGVSSRRPLLRPAFDRVAELAGASAAVELCSQNPAAVAAGRDVPAGRRPTIVRSAGWRRYFSRAKAA
jgi:protein-tyrosine phosphatase